LPQLRSIKAVLFYAMPLLREKTMKPIAWYDPTNGMVSTDKDSPLFTPLGQVLPLYSQRTWVGLTKEERHEISLANKPYVADIMAAHEAKLKEKNNG
jgi:hypothetical protein